MRARDGGDRAARRPARDRSGRIDDGAWHRGARPRDPVCSRPRARGAASDRGDRDRAPARTHGHSRARRDAAIPVSSSAQPARSSTASRGRSPWSGSSRTTRPCGSGWPRVGAACSWLALDRADCCGSERLSERGEARHSGSRPSHGVARRSNLCARSPAAADTASGSELPRRRPCCRGPRSR